MQGYTLYGCLCGVGSDLISTALVAGRVCPILADVAGPSPLAIYREPIILLVAIHAMLSSPHKNLSEVPQ